MCEARLRDYIIFLPYSTRIYLLAYISFIMRKSHIYTMGKCHGQPPTTTCAGGSLEGVFKPLNPRAPTNNYICTGEQNIYTYMGRRQCGALTFERRDGTNI